MRTTYAVTLALPQGCAVEDVVHSLRSWVARGVAPKDAFSLSQEGHRDVTHPLEASGHTLSTFQLSRGDTLFWEATWSCPPESRKGAHVISVALAVAEGHATLWVRQREALNISVLSSGVIETPPPAIVGRLLEKFPIQDGPARLLPTPFVIDAPQAASFVDSFLQSSTRTRPVLFFSAGPSSAAIPSIDTAKIATLLAGLAHVYIAADESTTKQISKRMGSLGCYGGAVRLYWPNLRLGDEPWRHHWWTPDRLAGWKGMPFEKYIFQWLSSQALTSFGSSLAVRSLHNRLLLEGLDFTSLPPPYNVIYSRLVKSIDEQEESLILYEQALVASQSKNSVAGGRGTPSARATFPPKVSPKDIVSSSASPATTPKPLVEKRETASSAIASALPLCRTIIVLPEFIESAQHCVYYKPSEIFAVLLALEQFAIAWKSVRPSARPEAIARRFGLEWRAGKKVRSGERVYEGCPISLCQYIQLGQGGDESRSTRVYICLKDLPDDRRVFVGHLGCAL